MFDKFMYMAFGFGIAGVMSFAFGGTFSDCYHAYITLSIVGIVFILITIMFLCLSLREERKK